MNNISEEARELAAKGRQKTEEIQDKILERSEEELEKGTPAQVEAQARELVAETRQNLEKTQEKILERAEEAMKE